MATVRRGGRRAPESSGLLYEVGSVALKDAKAVNRLIPQPPNNALNVALAAARPTEDADQQPDHRPALVLIVPSLPARLYGSCDAFGGG